MDWKKTFNLGQWVVHSVFIIAILIATSSTLYTLRLTTLQTTEEERLTKINSNILFLKQDESFDKMSKYLAKAQMDKAHLKLRELTQKIAETEDILEIKVGEALGQGIRTFNQLLNNNSSMGNLGEVLKVLRQKISSLHGISVSQKYKNVETISDRMLQRVEELSSKNAGGPVQASYLKADIGRLIQIVTASGLNEADKAALVGRAESMKYEVELIGNIVSESRNIKIHVNQASGALLQWLQEVDKKSLNLKNIREEKQNYLIIILSSFVAFLVFSWLALAYVFRWQRHKISLQVENEVKGVIEKGILGDQRFMVDHYSEATRENIVRLLDELKLKLNLGSLLHEGLPFAGCMIDQNFKLTWYNNLFLDQLYLSEEEVRSDVFNWDYVRDYLNLEVDPIYEAIVNKISGIYPVKAKQDEFTPAQPFEMYVTPICVNRESRVMVFFYPLISMKDAINEQVSLLKNPIEKFILLWNQEELNEDELKILERNFKSNDLGDFYVSLRNIFERLTEEKKEYIRTICEIEDQNDLQKNEISDFKKCEYERKIIIRDQIKTANELRNSFVSTIEKSESLINLNKSILCQNDEYKNEAQRLQLISQESNKRSKESMEVLGQLESVKADYKKLKLELLEVKAKLISLNSSLFAQLPPLDESQQKLAMRYKDELARLDFNVTTLDKKLSQLDVMLSKLSMIHEKKNQEQVNFSFQTSLKDHELKQSIFEIQKILSLEENKILDQFKSLHGLIKSDMNKNSMNLKNPNPEIHSLS